MIIQKKLKMKNQYIVILICLACTANVTISAQSRTVVGVVNDSQAKKPIKDVKISINGVRKTYKTDKKGNFKVKIENNTDTINFDHDGYYGEYFIVGTGSAFSVGLTKTDKPKTVDVGYGSISDRQVTSAVTTLEEKDFNKGAVTDIYQLLRGKIPGLIIKHTSSNITDAPEIYIRGASSFDGNQQPLIVIDGVMGASLNGLDPNDVASVTVLKDGSSTAMYGSRGNAGVIMIRSKKAKKKN